jgi:hypothetical protein
MNVNIVNNYNSSVNEDIDFDDVKIFDDVKLNRLMIRSLNGTSYKVAEVMYYLNKTNFNFGENNKWYEFKNHRWIKNSSIRNFISTKLITYYEKVLEHFEKNQLEISKIKKIKKIIDDLETTHFKNNIVTVEFMVIFCYKIIINYFFIKSSFFISFLYFRRPFIFAT